MSIYYNNKYAKKKITMQCLKSVTRCSFRSVYPYKEILSVLLLNKPKEPVLFTKQPFLAHEKLNKPLPIYYYFTLAKLCSIKNKIQSLLVFFTTRQMVILYIYSINRIFLILMKESYGNSEPLGSPQ